MTMAGATGGWRHNGRRAALFLTRLTMDPLGYAVDPLEPLGSA
jgi:hypothetical protein